MVTDSEIDEAILSYLCASEGRWRKIAMVIGRVADKLGPALQEGESEYNLIARRIEILVENGSIMAQGNIKKWRHSEIRKAG